MVFKFAILCTIIACANAGFVGAPVAYTAPVAVAKAVVSDDYDPNPQYSFGYDVQDGLTGDNKNQVETRNGDVVQGSYSLNDPDGTRRTVEYTADPINGFNAVVHKEPLVAKAVVAAPTVARIATPVTYAAPVAKVAAPITYSAPVAYATPVAKFATPVAYSAPVAYAAPTIAKVGAPLAYASPAVAKFAAPFAYSTSVIH